MKELIMKHKIVVLINLALLAMVSSSVLCSQIKSPLSNLSMSSMRKVEIDDPQYQMTAYTMEIPSSWKFAGTIARDPGCHSKGASLKYTVQSTDGLSAFVMMPGGFGTMDEFFEALTLIQTGKIQNFPLVVMGTEFWGKLRELVDGMLNAGTIVLTLLMLLVPSWYVSKIEPDKAIRFD